MKKLFFQCMLLTLCAIHHKTIESGSYLKGFNWAPIYDEKKENTDKLFDAINRNQTAEAIQAILKGADVNEFFKDGSTPLLSAIKNDLSDLVLFLIDRGADVHKVSKTGLSALQLALIKNNPKIMNALKNANAQAIYPIKQKESTDYLKYLGKVPYLRAIPAMRTMQRTTVKNELLQALKDNDLLDIYTSIDKGADPNTTLDPKGVGPTPLSVAIHNGVPSDIQGLITRGANVNAVDGATKLTPLLLAIKENKENIAIKLIELGANVNALNQDDQSCLSLAILQKQERVALKLIELGADINKIDPTNGLAPLMTAINNDLSKVALKLIDQGALINYTDPDGSTPLILATRLRNHPIMLKLINEGANLNQANSQNETPLIIAINNNDKESCLLLLISGAKISPSINQLRNYHDFARNPEIQFAIYYQTMVTKLQNDLQKLTT